MKQLFQLGFFQSLLRHITPASDSTLNLVLFVAQKANGIVNTIDSFISAYKAILMFVEKYFGVFNGSFKAGHNACRFFGMDVTAPVIKRYWIFRNSIFFPIDLRSIPVCR